jgi:class 3 adenylate cyclase
MSSVRRLIAIHAADVAGYSRLMGADEEGTHERLKAHLGELVNPKIGEHRGRIVKNTGDGFLAEFSSVVDAVRCATEIQRGMIDREPEEPDERRIRFRIVVNLGDVIVTAMAFRRAFEAPTHLYTMIAGNGLEPGADLRCKRGDSVGVAGLYTPVQLQSIAWFAR